VALFRNRITNLIQFVAAPGGYLEYRNSPEITNLQGIESEVKLTLTETLGGFINVSGQSGRNESTGEAVVGTARWRANAGFDLSPSDELTLHASLNVVGPRPRSASDPRPELSGYRVVDFAVNYNPVPKMELTVSVHNLFDADQRFPDLAGGLPADFPWEGRHFQAGIRWRF
jgi:outer membrane receptor protein involved in Fe transport